MATSRRSSLVLALLALLATFALGLAAPLATLSRAGAEEPKPDKPGKGPKPKPAPAPTVPTPTAPTPTAPAPTAPPPSAPAPTAPTPTTPAPTAPAPTPAPTAPAPSAPAPARPTPTAPRPATPAPPPAAPAAPAPAAPASPPAAGEPPLAPLGGPGAPYVAPAAPAIGDVLRASRGTWGGTAPLEFLFQWLRCGATGEGCVAIPGAEGPAYAVTAADAGSALRVAVLARNAYGSAEARSVQTATVPSPAVASAAGPVNTAAPAVRGVAEVGRRLRAVPGTWAGLAPISLSYRWRRCTAGGASCSTIAGADRATYVVRRADVGRTLQVLVTARNAVGSAQALSPPTPAGRMAFGPVTAFQVQATAASVRLRWQVPASPRLARVVIVRRVGARPTSPRTGTIVYRGRGRAALDFRRSSRRVWYAAFSIDRQGRASRPVVRSIARFMPALWGPHDGARVLSGPGVRFSWRPVAGATYYNIQIWRLGPSPRRLVTTWPRSTAFTFRTRLRPGRYAWYVFPGYGTLASARYGALLGQATFRVG